MDGRIRPKFGLRVFLIKDYILKHLRWHLALRHFSPSYPATAFYSTISTNLLIFIINSILWNLNSSNLKIIFTDNDCFYVYQSMF